jgi:hypothetical protein
MRGAARAGTTLRVPLRELLKKRVSCVYERIPGE